MSCHHHQWHEKKIPGTKSNGTVGKNAPPPRKAGSLIGLGHRRAYNVIKQPPQNKTKQSSRDKAGAVSLWSRSQQEHHSSNHTRDQIQLKPEGDIFFKRPPRSYYWVMGFVGIQSHAWGVKKKKKSTSRWPVFSAKNNVLTRTTGCQFWGNSFLESLLCPKKQKESQIADFLRGYFTGRISG